MLVSILTLYNNYPEIFDQFSVPEGLDKDTIIEGICIECSELELLYSDPEALALKIKNWTRRGLPVWNELQKTLEYQYNPIWNVEGSETMHIVREDTNTRTPDLQTLTKVSAFNEDDTLTPRGQVEESGTDKNHNKGEETRTFTRGMNLGVMTTQQLIREQRELVQFTVTEFIINSFKDNFCLLVY